MEKLYLIITNILDYFESIRLKGELDNISMSTYTVKEVIERIQNFVYLIGDDSVISLIENAYL